MKRIKLVLFSIFIYIAAIEAQEGSPAKFSPKQFDVQLQKCIIEEAGLTAEEQAQFFPIYKEMTDVQRKLFAKQRTILKTSFDSESSYASAISEFDAIDVKLKSIQSEYHKKLLKVIPASKLFLAMKAEMRFHRRQLRQWGKKTQEPGRH